MFTFIAGKPRATLYQLGQLSWENVQKIRFDRNREEDYYN